MSYLMNQCKGKAMAPVQMDHKTTQTYDPSLYLAGRTWTPQRSWDALKADDYAQQGFVVLEPALTEQMVVDARHGLTDLIHGQVPEFDQVQFEGHTAEELSAMTPQQRELSVRRVFSFCKYESRLDAVMRHPQLLAFVTKLMGGREPICFQEMALLKPPHGREKPWHQDNAYFDLDINEPVVGVWIALDDATIENGCMHVIPGSHHQGPKVHFQRRDWQICDTDILGQSITAVPLKAGGLMFFNGLMYHGTPHNPTQLRRRALQFHYCPKDAKWNNMEARLALFGSEGKDVTC